MQWTPAQELPTQEEKEIALGKLLFFDNILSADRSINCASCHIPAFAFSDTVAFSKGVGGRLGLRNAPSVMNMLSRDSVFWDGRAASLEAQVVFPIEDHNEMDLPFAEAVHRIQQEQTYQIAFKKVFGHGPDSASVVYAIAQFERSLETEDTPNDRWLNDEENSGMTAQMIRGRDLFTSDRTRCFDCHFTADFTDDLFHNIGLFNGQQFNDSGRILISKRSEDLGTFKTPGLRNVAITAPYMHDGSFKTLREVIDYYDEPAKFMFNSINRDTILPEKIGLTESEKDDLEAFLHSLTDDQFARSKK